jgi:tripartite-type tricarboxylate transporter receptor subunit TctC
MLVVPNSSPLRSVADLIAEAKIRALTSRRRGTAARRTGGELFATGQVDLTHVPYRGAAPAHRPAGRTNRYLFAVMASGLPLVESGSCARVTTAGRVQAAPDVPTIAEAGVPGYDTSSWFAFFVPAKTPPEIIKKMHADIVAVLAEPPIRAKLDQQGLIPIGSTPEELGAHFRSEMEKWAPVIKAAGIKVEK